MKSKEKCKNKLKINNVFVSSYGYYDPWNDNHNLEEEELLRPFVENELLKTDFDSLQKVAKVLDDYNGKLVVINTDGTIMFFDANY